VDAQGNVYLADTGNNRVVVTDMEGNFRYQWGYAGSAAGAFNEPIGIGVDAQGNVYVGDTWNRRIQVFAPGAGGQIDPLPIRTIPVAGWEPGTYDDPFIAVASTGDLLVSIPSTNALAFVDRNGREWFRWGEAGNDLSSLRNPTGVTFGANGAMFAVDRGNQRILRFQFPMPGR
jgi:sugar lactone lactonase YvrE